MDDFGVRLAAVNKHDEEQDQFPRHTDDLVTLLAVTRDEVVVRRHVNILIIALLASGRFMRIERRNCARIRSSWPDDG